MQRDFDNALILTMLATLLALVACGFSEILARLKPRIIYVYSDDKKEPDIPIWKNREREPAA